VQKGYAAFKLATESTTIAQAALNFVMGANPFGIIAIAIGALVAAGIALYKNWDVVKEKAIELKDKIFEVWNNLITGTIQWGKDLVTGLWNGITEKASWIYDKITGFAEGISSKFKDFFGIQSPSTLMSEYGQYIDDGLAQGIENNANKPLDAIKSISESIGQTIDDTVNKINGFVAVSNELVERIKNYDKQNYSSSGGSLSSDRYQKHRNERDNFYEANKDEINAISKRQNVDLSVAQDMLRDNLLNNIAKYANGTNYHPGGLALVGEQGAELLNLPKGTQVLSNEDSREMLKQGDTIIHVYNPQPSPATLARQIKKAQQELALGF
jgi:phage-related protein